MVRVPDRVLIVIGTESYFGRSKPGEFVYRFIKCGDSISS
jgi:hypothetical protein